MRALVTTLRLLPPSRKSWIALRRLIKNLEEPGVEFSVHGLSLLDKSFVLFVFSVEGIDLWSILFVEAYHRVFKWSTFLIPCASTVHVHLVLLQQCRWIRQTLLGHLRIILKYLDVFDIQRLVFLNFATAHKSWICVVWLYLKLFGVWIVNFYVALA